MTIRNSFPDVRPALNLDFANSKRLDPRITFTRSSTGTYVDEFGVIKTAASNEARFDHDSDGNSLGLLIEEARTNLVTYSEVNTGWAQTPGVSYVTGYSSSPDGATSSIQVTFSVSTNFTKPGGTITVVSGTVYTFSIYLKADSLSWAAIRLFNTDADDYYYFDLTTGALGASSTQARHAIESVGNGWYRCSVFATHSVTTSGFTVYGASADETLAAGSLQVWGAQLEEGSFPTSYIPTSGSTATRSADVASMTGTNFSSWYNQSEGTLLIQASNVKETKYCGALTSGTTGTPDTLAIYHKDNDEWRIYHTSQVTFSDTGDTANVAMGYSVGGTTRTASAAWKGTLVSSVPTDSSHIDFTSLQIGTGPKGAGYSCGHTSRLTYYDRRLTDAQLQALTL